MSPRRPSAAKSLNRCNPSATSPLPPLEPSRRTSSSVKLDLGFTKVLAPISGRVSRMLVTEGNLVQSGQNGGGTLLTTHRVGGPDLCLLRRGRAHGAARPAVDPRRQGRSARDDRVARVAGAGHRRRVSRIAGRSISSTTRSIRKPEPCGCGAYFPTATRLLDPGFFGRVRVPIGQPHDAVLVTDRAIDNDQGQKIVYVVNEKNEVAARPCATGALHDGLREITDGLKPGERVVVNGLQQVRPGMTVEPKIVQMPGQKAPATSEPSAKR